MADKSPLQSKIRPHTSKTSTSFLQQQMAPKPHVYFMPVYAFCHHAYVNHASICWNEVQDNFSAKHGFLSIRQITNQGPAMPALDYIKRCLSAYFTEHLNHHSRGHTELIFSHLNKSPYKFGIKIWLLADMNN